MNEALVKQLIVRLTFAADLPDDTQVVKVARAVADALPSLSDAVLAEAGLFRAQRKQYARQGRYGSLVPVMEDDPRRSHYRPFGAWTPVKEDDGG